METEQTGSGSSFEGENNSEYNYESSEEEDSFVDNKRISFGKIVNTSDESSDEESFVCRKPTQKHRKVINSDSEDNRIDEDNVSESEDEVEEDIVKNSFRNHSSADDDSNERIDKDNNRESKDVSDVSESEDEVEEDIVKNSFRNHSAADDDSNEETNEDSEPSNEDSFQMSASEEKRETQREITDASFVDPDQDSDQSLHSITNHSAIRNGNELSASSSNIASGFKSHTSEENGEESFQTSKDISAFEVSESEEPSIEVIENTPTVVDISSGEEEYMIEVKPSPNSTIRTPLRQLRVDTMLKQHSNWRCSPEEYANQAKKVAEIRQDMLKCTNLLNTLNLDGLPDKGMLLKDKRKYLEEQLEKEDCLLKKMISNVEGGLKPKSENPTWAELQAKSDAVAPRTFGARAMATYNMQKTLTMDRLKNLHDSIATIPTEDSFAEDPKGLKVSLMPHQKRALAWLLWRENQKPSGGILADDMGLGKTLTMISLLLKVRELKQGGESHEDDVENEPAIKTRKKFDGRTLVICPATLIGQWDGEVTKRCKKHLISVEIYHGPTRDTNAKRLAKYDMVITTYHLVMGEHNKDGPLYGIKWKRIILDEAHVIRNHKSRTSLSICDLSAKSRWALTGTPLHNKDMDLYALFKFLKCSPFDDLQIWKRWVDNKSAGGQERLNTVITSIMLRRTKEQLLKQGDLNGLPEKKLEVISVELDVPTKKLYQKILVFSKTLFAQFLHQRTEKNVDFVASSFPKNKNSNDEYYKLHKKILQMQGAREVRAHEILVLLLRIRQICCHPSLIVGMLNDEHLQNEDIEEDEAEMDILDKLKNLNIEDEDPDLPNENETEKLSDAASKILSTANPVFAEDRTNGKIRVTKEIITEKVLANGDKVVVVSQWTGMLNIIAKHLENDRISYSVLDGKVPVAKRNQIVENFNNAAHKIKVLLLSLTAGGVGLNLIGANHLVLLDLHWNPQLESQAQDRIYRVGQEKSVCIYKIVTKDTIEERIKVLQDSKLSMAQDILTGTKTGASKLSMNDLKMLFNVM